MIEWCIIKYHVHSIMIPLSFPLINGSQIWQFESPGKYFGHVIP